MDQNSSHVPDRYLVIAASLKADSLNSRLARLAAKAIAAKGGEVDFASMERLDMPSYSADVEISDGFPGGAEEFRSCLEAADAFLIVSPEYNFSMPGMLKNAIDWVSRFRPQPFNEHMGMLMSASPSMAGGNRGLWALRVPLEHLGARIYPDMFSLAQAHEAFTDDGALKNQQLHTWLEGTIANFMSLVEANKHYPCMKAAWIEFLGEQPDPAFNRVE